MRPNTITTLILLIISSAITLADTNTTFSTFEPDSYTYTEWVDNTTLHDENWTTYGRCSLDLCWWNFSYTSDYADLYIIEFAWNDTARENITLTDSACDQEDPIEFYVNLTNATNSGSISCYGGSWKSLSQIDSIDWYEQRLWMQDITPAVTISLPADGYTKECNSQQKLDELPVVFASTDNLDDSMNCSLFINDKYQSSNASTLNNTDTILYGTVLEGVNNSVYVACYDHHGFGNSTTQYVTGEQCTQCADEFGDYALIVGVIIALLLFFAGTLFGQKEVWKYWYIILFFIALVYVLWYVQNWDQLC